MNSTNVFPSLWRFAVLVLIQALIFKQVSLVAGQYFNIFIYPLFILLLPIQTPMAFTVILGFAVGLAVDLFYATPGVHASAGTFSGLTLKILLAAFEPRGGYTNKEPIASPAYFGWPWFMQIASLFFFLHLFWYFSVDAFTFVYFGTITLKTLAAWLLTMIFVVFYGFLINPKN